MSRRLAGRLILLIVCSVPVRASEENASRRHYEPVKLGGTWSVQLDREDRGEVEQWFARELSSAIILPGVLTAQGYGDPVSMQTQWTGNLSKTWTSDPYYRQYQTPENFKMPFWLQPDRHYVGAAWYQRQVEVPPEWQGKRVTLFLERPHWKTTVWLDDRALGSQDRLGTPHVYELGVDVAPGQHRLTIRVDNRMIVDVGNNAHSVSDHTQGNWNGIVGRMELQATDPVWIYGVWVYPNIKNETVRVAVGVGNSTGTRGGAAVSIHVAGVGRPITVPVPLESMVMNATCTYPMGSDCRLWDEFHPNLYTMMVEVKDDTGKYRDQTSVQFGMREVGTQGTRIAVNGRPIFLRGTLECCIFPLTGHPPTDVDAWKRIIRIAKAYGLNLFRFHSYCPPEAAFVAADELGFYYQVEIFTLHKPRYLQAFPHLALNSHKNDLGLGR
jgi:hypothetical protein